MARPPEQWRALRAAEAQVLTWQGLTARLAGILKLARERKLLDPDLDQRSAKLLRQAESADWRER